MIKLLKLFLICCVFFNLACEKKEKRILYKEIEVQAPFVMPTIKEPNFNLVPKFNIIDYGALEGDKDKNTQAIAEAIQIASNGGGGIVIVPEGEWLTKKIHLKSKKLDLENQKLDLKSQKLDLKSHTVTRFSGILLEWTLVKKKPEKE